MAAHQRECKLKHGGSECTCKKQVASTTNSEDDRKALAKSYYELLTQLSVHTSMGVNRDNFEQSYNYDVRNIELVERLKRAKDLFEDRVKKQMKW